MVNKKVPRLFFAESIGVTRPSVKYLMREKKKFLERVFKQLLGSKAKPSPPKTVCEV